MSEPIWLAAPYLESPWVYIRYPAEKAHEWPAAEPFYPQSTVTTLRNQVESFTEMVQEQDLKIVRLEDEISDLKHQLERLSTKVHCM